MTTKTPPRNAGAPRLLPLSPLFVATLVATGCSSSSDGPAPDPAPQFAAVNGFNSNVGSIVDAGDGTGDLFFSGDFTHFGDSPAHGLLRLNSDLTLDPAFQAPQEPLDGPIQTIEPSGDGTVFIAGSFSGIGLDALPGFGRILPDGSVDPSFNAPTFNSTILAMSMAPDATGDLFVGGDFGTVTSPVRGGGASSPRLERLTSTGAVSGTFDIGSGFNGTVRVIVPVPDMSGDIYVGGDFSTLDGTSSPRLVRLNGDGTIDSTMSVGTSFNGGVYAIQPLLDGSGDVWVGGNFSSYQGTDFPKMVLLNGDGTVDAGFQPAVSSIGGIVNSIELVSPTGSDVIVSGTFSAFGLEERDGMALVRADGSISADFTAGQSGSAGGVSTVVVRPNMEPAILVGGSFESFGGAGSIGFVGLSAAGDVMTSFGSGTDDEVYQILTAANGETYVIGDFNTFDGQDARAMMRLRPDGSLDTSFNLPDVSYIEVYDPIVTDGPTGALYAMAYVYDYGDNEGFAGPRGGDQELVRFNRDGSFDETFILSEQLSIQPFSICAVMDGSGDLYAAGPMFINEGFQDVGVVRLNGDGSLDSTFQMSTSIGGFPSGMTIANDGSGDLFVYGDFYDQKARGGNNIGLLRLNADGSSDESFDVGTGFNDELYEVLCATDGSGDLYVLGDFSTFGYNNAAGLVRLQADGSIDEDFVPPSVMDGYVDDMAMASDGSGDLLLVGYFDSWNYIDTPQGFVRLSPTGSIVTEGMPETSVGENGDIYAISARQDGSGGYYLGGDFMSFGNRAAQNLVRLGSDWSAE